jgi:predicted XRE-type DNA-binding protein
MTEQNVPAKSSGNVFADLGVPHPREAMAKAELAHQIARVIKERKLTQTTAAEILGVDQAKVSALARGRLRGFSTDRLFRFLNALDQDIEITVKQKPTSRDHARVHVIAP